MPITSKGPQHQPLILIVDDNRDSRLLLHRFLEGNDYQVLDVQDGKEALHTCERIKPDIILLDYMMPVMDGFQTCARLRALPNFDEVPILMITGMDEGNLVERAFSAGATDYISKPVNPTVLKQRVQHLLQAHQMENTLQEKQFLYQAIIEGYSDALFLLDVATADEYRFVFANQAFASLAGLPAEQITGKVIEETLAGQQAARMSDYCTRAIEEMTAQDYEETYTYRTQPIYVSTRLTPVREGNSVRIVGSCIDISNQKLFEGLIEKGKQEWEKAVDSLSVMIILTDHQNHILRCNRPTIEYLEMDYSDLLGKKIGEVLFVRKGIRRELVESHPHEVKVRFGEKLYQLARYPVEGRPTQPQYVYMIKQIEDGQTNHTA